MCCDRYFGYLKCEKGCWFFALARFACSKLWKLVNFRTFCAKKLFKDFICFVCRIREVHFSELVKGICHLSAARRQIGHKATVFWSVKNWIWSGKSQWKIREFCFCMRVAILMSLKKNHAIWIKFIMAFYLTPFRSFLVSPIYRNISMICRSSPCTIQLNFDIFFTDMYGICQNPCAFQHHYNVIDIQMSQNQILSLASVSLLHSSKTNLCGNALGKLLLLLKKRVFNRYQLIKCHVSNGMTLRNVVLQKSMSSKHQHLWSHFDGVEIFL